MNRTELTQEWQVLQNQFDSYEKYSLVIKLLNVGVFFGAYVTDKLSITLVAVMLVVWMQDAIWKTFQARIDSRLQHVELGLERIVASGTESSQQEPQSTPTPVMAYQYNRAYAAQRPSHVGLLKEYLSNACRPTVAFPHCILVLIVGLVVI